MPTKISSNWSTYLQMWHDREKHEYHACVHVNQFRLSVYIIILMNSNGTI